MEANQARAGHRLKQFIDSLDISKAEFSRETGLNYAHMFRILMEMVTRDLTPVAKSVRPTLSYL